VSVERGAGNTAAGSRPVDVPVTIPEGDGIAVAVQLIDSDSDAVGMFVDWFEAGTPDRSAPEEALGSNQAGPAIACAPLAVYEFTDRLCRCDCR